MARTWPILIFANEAEREAHLKAVGTVVTVEQMIAGGYPQRKRRAKKAKR
jgi:hypothetical protein